MSKAFEAKEIADEFNEPSQKEKRMKDVVGYIVDILLEDTITTAKRGLYDMSHKLDDTEKERIRLANLQEEEVIKFVVEKMIELGFSARFNRPYINISWG